MVLMPNDPLLLAGTAVPLIIAALLERPVLLRVVVREPTGMGAWTCVLWWHAETCGKMERRGGEMASLFKTVARR